ncbi:hypothetical protein JW906_03895 [bacterium]|nr:hypothetical protein [bacterium]
MHSKTFLYFVLDWGLGHATRSIALIRAILDQGHRVVIVSTGRSLSLLRREFTGCTCIDLPDYHIRYSRYRPFLVPHLIAQVPGILIRIHREQRRTEKLASRYGADYIVSDNRYGCFSKNLPSFLMTHQLRFHLPRQIAWSAWMSEWFNRFQFRHYRKVFIPDEAAAPNLSGELSHRGRIAGNRKLFYAGPLSSLKACKTGGEGIGFLFIVSGPEPQRTHLEELLLDQAADLPGRKVMVLGKPESDHSGISRERGFEIYPHVTRSRMAAFICRAQYIIGRSGYSTIMDLAASGKKAILLPTPGQTEQEYLARHVRESGLFFSLEQKNLDLKKALKEADAFYMKSRPVFGCNRLDDILSRITDGKAGDPRLKRKNR